MEENHSTYKEDLAAYALGALDPEQALALEEHLQTCEACRAEIAGYQRVSTGLLAALPAQPPRPAARRQLQKRLAGQTARTRPQFNWSLGQLVFAGLMAALVALNLLTISQVYSLKREQAELINKHTADQTAIAMLAYPTTKTLAFEENGISGSLLVDKTRNLVAVFAWNMPLAPAGKSYQMWLVDPQGHHTSGGLLAPEAAYPFVLAVIRSPQPLSGFTGIGVTVEPSGGSPQPTGPRILHVDF